MIRILHLAKIYTGNYNLFNEMARLDPQKFETYFCYMKGCSDGQNEMQKLACAVFYDFRKSHGLIFNKTRTAYSLSKIIDQYEIDIVNCQLEKMMPVGVLASLLSKKKPKVIATVHGLVRGSTHDLRKKIKNYIYYRFLDKVICVSNSVKNELLQTYMGNISNKVVCVQNGLNYDRFLSEIPKEEAKQKILPPSQSNSFWFGIVGRLAEVKNHKNVIDAFRKVVDKNPDGLLLIVGEGPLKEKLCAKVDALKLTKKVLFLGHRRDVPVILKSLDVFLFPSYREGLPLALLEAMVSGLPVVASDIAVVREIIDDLDIARLADPENPAALADAMVALMELPKDKLQQMGETAKAHALNDFSADKMSRAYEALYENISNNVSG